MDAKEKRLTERVIGCAIAVSNELGAGFLEAVYGHALAIELARAGIAYEAQKALEVRYKVGRSGTIRPILPSRAVCYWSSKPCPH